MISIAISVMRNRLRSWERVLPAIMSIGLLCAQDVKYAPQGQLFPGPPTPAQRNEWLAELKHYRAERLARIGYDGRDYERRDFSWIRSSFIQPQAMVEDRYFYDPAQHRYTVDRYLDDVEKRYGGIDSILLWPIYPNIGVDDRNLFDHVRDMPGGIAGLKAMVADFHRRNVKVLFPIMPWDTGTRDEGKPQWQAIATLLKAIDADGINGDTLNALPRAYRTASDEIGHPLALEPENGVGPNEPLAWNNMGWGYWTYGFIPGVSVEKWLEPRKMIHVCRRWGREKTDDLQYAFFNGVGYESWENVWGIWNGTTPRDSEAIRRVAAILRQFPDNFISMEWEPHVPTLQYGVYASRFPAPGQTVWTVINRNEYDVAGEQISLDDEPGMRFWDAYHGAELQPARKDGRALLSFPIERKGYGAVIASRTPPDSKFLVKMKDLSARPLESYSGEWKPLAQTMAEPAKATISGAPEGMVKVPAGQFEFRVSGIEIEGGNDVGVDVQYPWEPTARRHHAHTLDVASFWIDKYPVTNRQFARFLSAAHYQPADDHNFLRTWPNRQSAAEADQDRPVTWVSLEDAQAYCQAAGKRLPREWEWQYAAQGTDGRTYPWGDEWNAAAVPTPDRGRSMRQPDPVGAHPQGASPFGVHDMTGNVWQWTSEFRDEHTRAAIVRGGSYYQPQGSHWYFPQAYKLNEHGKLLLIAPSKDRSGAIGFRCAADAS